MVCFQTNSSRTYVEPGSRDGMARQYGSCGRTLRCWDYETWLLCCEAREEPVVRCFPSGRDEGSVAVPFQRERLQGVSAAKGIARASLGSKQGGGNASISSPCCGGIVLLSQNLSALWGCCQLRFASTMRRTAATQRPSALLDMLLCQATVAMADGIWRHWERG
jgi:hypothetical protein